MDEAIVWLSRAGHVVGLPNGTVVRPQASAVSVQLPESGGSHFHNGYIITTLE